MQKVVYISNSRDFTEQNDINNNQYLVRINRLLEEGWVISQMNTQTVDVDQGLKISSIKKRLCRLLSWKSPRINNKVLPQMLKAQ